MAPSLSVASDGSESYEGIPLNLIVYSLFEDAQHGNLPTNRHAIALYLREEDVLRAIRMDQHLAGQNPDVDPEPENLKDLVRSRIEAIERAYNSPEAVALRARQAEEDLKAANARLAEEKFHDRLITTAKGLLGTAVSAGAFVVLPAYFATPYIFDGVQQARMDWVASNSMADRADHLKPIGGMDLEGALVRFACRSAAKQDDVTGSTDVRWEPVRIDEVWSHAQLKVSFGVQWNPEKSRSESLAEAGWGNTVSFTLDQIEAGYPDALRAVPVQVREYGPAAIIPTGAFIRDPDRIVGHVFTTGMVSPDGHMNTYYLIDPSSGDLACYEDAPITADSEPVRMVTAQLVKELPEKDLSAFGVVDLEPSSTFTANFEKYGLDEWYERTYPALVISVNNAIRDGSKRGVPNSTLKEMADYLEDREFEQAMLRLMIFMKTQYGDKAFQSVVESVEVSRTPSLILTDEVYLRSQVADGSSTPGARGAIVRLVKDARVKHVLTHELMHAYLQGSLPKNGLWDGMRYGDFGEQDVLLFEPMTEFFTQIALGGMQDFGDSIPANAAYRGRFELFQYLTTQGGDKVNLLNHYLLQPSLDLTPTQLGVLVKIGAPIPENKTTRHLYAMFLEHLHLTEDSAPADLKKAKTLFDNLRVFAGMDLNTNNDLADQEDLAREILRLLK